LHAVPDFELNTIETNVKLRMDVDYAYPWRLKSFLYTILGIKMGHDYLKNCKIIARMINESTRRVKAYWFFTLKTTPDAELLGLLTKNKHEIALHIATRPSEELNLLEQATKRPINYYTVHGTERLLARLMWRRKLSEAKATVPYDFPLQSFHAFPTVGIDVLCFSNSPETVVSIAERSITQGRVLHFHPEWLFQRGTINRRGPFYDTLKRILGVDKELSALVIRKTAFFRIVKNEREYQRDFVPTDNFLSKLVDRDFDIYTFIERQWCFRIPEPKKSWVKTEDNIALLKIATYNEWWRSIGKKTRNMVRKSKKSGVRTRVIGPSEKLAEGIWKVYNEVPIRQERAFPHYGISLPEVKNIVFSSKDDTFIGAFIGDELVGFIQLVYGDKIGIIQQILSFQKHADKAVNNALIAKTVEVCIPRRVKWLMYGRMGNHPSLDNFKANNGFTKFAFPRYYIPLSMKGRIAMKLGLHKELKDSLPEALKSPLFPVFNWISRTKQRIKLGLFSNR
jgi:hypothetical protein